MEPSSPLVDGLSISERDRLIAEVRKISKSIAGNKCDKARSDQFVSTLSKLGWTFELAASWCKKWWKHERVLLAPYAKPNGKKCLNYLWLFQI